MKKIILSLLLLSAIGACKKPSDETPSSATVYTSAMLVGTWDVKTLNVKDYDGSKTLRDTTYAFPNQTLNKAAKAIRFTVDSVYLTGNLSAKEDAGIKYLIKNSVVVTKQSDTIVVINAATATSLDFGYNVFFKGSNVKEVFAYKSVKR